MQAAHIGGVEENMNPSEGSLFANQALNLLVKTFEEANQANLNDQQNLDRHTADLNELEALWNVAQVHVANYISQQRQLRNSRTPLYQLPSEILVSILEITAANTTRFVYKPHWNDASWFYRALAELMSVSKYLYTLIVTTPSLWTDCEIDSPPTLLSQIVQRSKSHSIDIDFLTIDIESWEVNGEVRRARHGAKVAPKFAAAIVPHHDRWRNVTFMLHHSTVKSHLPLLESALPRLKELVVSIHPSSRVSLPLALNLEGSNGVRLIDLEGVLPSWTPGQLKGLESLCLTDLKAKHGQAGMSLRLLFDALRHSPRLKNFDLDGVDFVDDASGEEVLSATLPLEMLILDLPSSTIIHRVITFLGKISSYKRVEVRHRGTITGASDALVHALQQLVPALVQMNRSDATYRSSALFLHDDGRIHFNFAYFKTGQRGDHSDHLSNCVFHFETRSPPDLHLSELGWFANILRLHVDTGSFSLHLDPWLDWSTPSVRQFFCGLKVSEFVVRRRSTFRGLSPPRMKAMMNYLGEEVLSGGGAEPPLPELEQLQLEDLEDATETDILSMLQGRYARGNNPQKILKLNLSPDPLDETIVQEMKGILGPTNVRYPSWKYVSMTDGNAEDELDGPVNPEGPENA